ncbi:MAG TPA: histidine--tRNA ligase [Burkholderiaceae bacterium]|nr:histidine--tRNA ligase [Burkholderiaceae bacterium]
MQAIRGMNDILPADIAYWQHLETTARQLFAEYGYQEMRVPMVEHTALFKRSIGELTDIVEKEMYAFEDALNGEHLSLRPENTAGVCRAVIEHNLTYEGGRRLWYAGPMFRHERPQRGRYRQFHQVGAEAIGFAGPDVDAELILMCARLWESLELPNIELQLNSLGNSDERARHRADLIAHLERHQDALDADAKRRLHANPLRVLDSKHPDVQAVAQAAPKLIDYLGEDSRAHFDGLQRLLKSRGVKFEINPRLVRGLDYYNLTVFEWISTAGDSPLTVCGGGRYDGLIELLGGKPTPACGFGLGVERVLDLLAQEKFEVIESPDVYVVHAGEGASAYALQVGEALRDAGFDVIVHAGEGSFKSQMKRADAAVARYAVVIGEDEVRAGEVTLKHLRGPDGEPVRGAEQRRFAVAQLVEALYGELGFDDDTHDHDH